MSSGFAGHGPREGTGRGDHAPFGIIEGLWRYGGEPMTYAIPVIDLENVQLSHRRRCRLRERALAHLAACRGLAENSAGR